VLTCGVVFLIGVYSHKIQYIYGYQLQAEAILLSAIRMKHKILTLIFGLFLSYNCLGQNSFLDGKYRVVEKDIYADSVKIIETTLFNLEILGEIITPTLKAPVLLLSGVDCDYCDANIALYIHASNVDKLEVKSGENSYSLAIKLFDFTGEELIYENRVFYGELKPNYFGIIWVQKTLTETGWKESNYILNINEETYSVDEFKESNQELTTRLEKLKTTGRVKELNQISMNEPP
tara:strand:- start:1641 stop:2342 length:702 start_codon:yes stop_codon:yes gene_type:complete